MSSETFSTQSSARSEQGTRLARMGVLVGLAASWLVEPGGPRGPLRLASWDLPVLCPIRKLTGHRCPSCGMTRGMVYMFRMRIREALRANVLSPIAFVSLIVIALGWQRGKLGVPDPQTP